MNNKTQKSIMNEVRMSKKIYFGVIILILSISYWIGFFSGKI